MRESSPIKRGLIALLALFLTVMPLPPCANGAGDCCGGGSGGANCGEKETRVYWHLVGDGWGSVDVKGYYLDANNVRHDVVGETLVLRDNSHTSVHMEKCGNFCAPDGVNILARWERGQEIMALS